MGLRHGDLKDLVYDVFEIDSYASKMGEDKNIVTLSFSVKDRAPADDLVKFLEGGYSFILDSDVTSGEQADGTYKVFVELERDNKSNDNIMEIVDGIKKLSEIEKFRFRYYKNFRSHNISIESLNEFVPTDPDNYGIKVNESNLDNYKNFFSKSYVDDIVMTESILTIKKSYADPLHFKFIDFGPTVKTLNSIKESFNTQDFSEIIFLSKYVGDYNITKYGNKLTFENSGSTLVLERIT
mgnify:FL=1|jgi:hypothetical protein|tara:strand:- start:92 stop:808 length:717 start_codon:yes stop_codon:yes gene_type:complete